MAGRLGDTMKTAPMVTCMKTLLMVFNFIFWVTGIAILVLGIWMKLQLYVYIKLTTIYYSAAPYILIGVGAGILIIGSLGCLCTVKGKAFFLYLYAGFMFIVFIAEFAVAIAAFIYRGKLQEGFRQGLGGALRDYNDDADKKKAVDGLQQGLKCCGIESYTDWFNTSFAAGKKNVPKTCCKTQENCKSDNLPLKPGNATMDIYTNGCYSSVTTFMQKNFSIIGGVAIGFSFLQLFGSLLACSLAKNINKAKYEQVA